MLQCVNSQSVRTQAILNHSLDIVHSVKGAFEEFEAVFCVHNRLAYDLRLLSTKDQVFSVSFQCF